MISLYGMHNSLQKFQIILGGFVIIPITSLQIFGFVVADLPNYPDIRRSTSGYCFFLGLSLPIYCKANYVCNIWFHVVPSLMHSTLVALVYSTTAMMQPTRLHLHCRRTFSLFIFSSGFHLIYFVEV